ANHDLDLRMAQRFQYELGRLHLAARQYDEAERALRRRVDLCRLRLEQNPENRRSRARLIDALRDLGDFLENYGAGDPAEPLLVEGIQVARQGPTPTTSDEPDDFLPIRQTLEFAELARLEKQPDSVVSHAEMSLAALGSSPESLKDAGAWRSLAAKTRALRA